MDIQLDNEYTQPGISPDLVQGLLSRKMEKEKQDYLAKVGNFPAKLKVRRFWKSVFEAGGRGEDPPKMQDSGIPYLVLQMFHPKGQQAHKDFLRGRKSLPVEKQEEMKKLSAERMASAVKAKEEAEKKAGIETPIDDQVKGLLPPEQLEALTPEQKQELALSAQRLLADRATKIKTQPKKLILPPGY